MDENQLTVRELEALRHIRSALVHGTAPSVRELQASMGYRSPRSAAYIIDKLIKRGFLRRRNNDKLQLRRDPDGPLNEERTIEVPLVGSVPCGAPLLAEENIEAMVLVSRRLARPPHHYFLLRGRGDSMNRAGIENGDLVLVRRQSTAENGERVVALIDDEATIKEFRQGRDVVTLEPRSASPEHRPIVLTRDFQIQGVVVATISKFEGSE